MANSTIHQMEAKKGTKVFPFVIRFVQLTRMIERFFSVETEVDRDSWFAPQLPSSPQMS